MEITRRTEFDAEEFVEDLLSEGSKVFYDESVAPSGTVLPKFYNEELHKRGQLVYEKHKFALNFAMLMGLIAGLAVPYVRNILSFTKMTSTPYAACKRYKRTVRYVNFWYQNNFSPESGIWKSIAATRSSHLSANAQLAKAGKQKISQREMGLTLGGFIGYALMEGQKTGLHNVSEEEWKGLIHIWRVIGYLMGVEDRFNTCRESVKETKEIFDVIKKRVVTPFALEMSNDFVFMVTNVVDGVIIGSSFVNTNVLMGLGFKLAELKEDGKRIKCPVSLTTSENLMVSFITLIIASLKFGFFRRFFNYLLSNVLI